MDDALTDEKRSPVLQNFGDDPLKMRETDHYHAEYIQNFVEKWDELIDWRQRASSEGRFFIDILKGRGKRKVLDVATGTGFHSIQLLKAGFDVTSVDGNAEMLGKAFENARDQGHILKTMHSDWRWLNRDVHSKYDAIICLGNSFTHLFTERDRRRALAEFYAALRYDGILILDQRNYDALLDGRSKPSRKYYYCGKQVTAEPEHVDDGLARFKYAFPDGSEYRLNMFPLRRKYVTRLLNDVGFFRITTYGDFQELDGDEEPDFYIHIAEKAYDAGQG
ncbi:MAG: class I SAM-dependent methyltransferase [Rhodobacteraceae bacterium]|nr:class I SAM-dependent methyltransferase [Paracoccaceae bacterium]